MNIISYKLVLLAQAYSYCSTEYEEEEEEEAVTTTPKWIRSPAVGRKADRTVYDVRHSRKTLSGIGIGSLVTTATPDVEISAVRLLCL